MSTLTATTSKSLAAGLRLQAIERGHFGAAGNAPGRPEIEDERAAAKIGERQLAPVRAVEGDRDRGPRRPLDGERGDFALRERRQARGSQRGGRGAIGLGLAGRRRFPV